MVPHHITMMTLEDAYNRYKTLNPNDKIGLAWPNSAAYAQLKSKRCQPCCNAALKGESLKFISPECKEISHIVITSKRSAITKTLCSYDTKYARANCLYRKCNACESKLLIDHYKDVLQQHKDIQWCQWQYVTIQKDEDSSKRVISCITTTTTTLEEFMQEYQKDMETLPAHLFRADWQHQQMTTCI